MFRTVIYLVFLTSVVVAFTACGDSEINDLSPGDYREVWVGSYEGTKSNTSFEDTMFTTVVTFEVSIDEDSPNGLIVNDINFPISEEGTYGPDFLEGGITNYELSISDGELRLHSFNSVIPGTSIPCYIIATQQ